MRQTIGDLIHASEASDLIGRDREIAFLMRCLDDGGPIVTWLYGMPGIGKSALVRHFGTLVKAEQADFTLIDCHEIEPTPESLIASFTAKPDATERDAAAALSNQATDIQRSIVVFDNYEVFRLMDTWLRRKFIPLLPGDTRIILVSREAPTAGWVGAGEWARYFTALKIGMLADTDASQLLRRAGIGSDAARQLARLTMGHPVALSIAAATSSWPSTAGHDAAELRDILSELTRHYLADLPEPLSGSVLESLSVVRRITRPMLAALLPDNDTDAIYEALGNLSFFESRPDGLAMQEPLRQLVAEQFRAADAAAYRRCQQRAWRALREGLRQVAPADLWRSTADTIFLLSNPVIREAFFPSASSDYFVEPATPQDEAAICSITRTHDGSAAEKLIRLWWQQLPEAFHVVRDSAGKTLGFYCLALPEQSRSDWMQGDPVAARWCHDIHSTQNAPHSLLLRRWLSANEGEAPCGVQAAAWIDIKRTYLELRPNLDRVYLTLRDPAPYAAVASQLGFVIRDELAASAGGQRYHTAVLDFGPGSVDGWILRLLESELDTSAERLLDSTQRELVLGDRRVPLTPKEFGVLSLLEARAGKAVSRDDILKTVWKRDADSSSNVVDAVVRGLRKKMGASGDRLETVRGHGFRLRS